MIQFTRVGAVKFGRIRKGKRAGSGSRHPTAPGWFLTDAGRVLIRFPLDPRLSRALLEARRLGVLRQVLMLAAMMSLENIFSVRKRRAHATGADGDDEDADSSSGQRQRAIRPGGGIEGLVAPSGDHLTLLNVFRGFIRAAKSPGGRPAFRKRFALDARALTQATRIHRQISAIAARLLSEMDALRLRPASESTDEEEEEGDENEEVPGARGAGGGRLTRERESELVLRSLLAGFWPQCARLAPLAAGESRSKIQRLYVPVRADADASSGRASPSSSPPAAKKSRTTIDPANSETTAAAAALPRLPTHLKLHPSSALFHTRPPPLLLYTQLLVTSASFLKCASRIEQRWLDSASAASCKLASAKTSSA